MIEDILFSIITPAYCGSTYLRRLAANLAAVKIKYSNFEWIIVDDCSPDQGQTIDAINKIQEEGILEVRSILFTKNYYNSRSIPAAAEIAKGSYSIILDQDDQLLEDALLIFSKYISQYKNRADFAGVCGRCVNLNGTPIGTKLPIAEMYAKETEIRHRYRVRGEMSQCTRTELVRKYFLALNPGNTNGLGWLRIAKECRYVYVEQFVRVYDTNNPNSVSNIRKVRHVSHYAAQQIEYLNCCVRYIFNDPLNLIRISIHAQRFAIHSHQLCGKQLFFEGFSIKLLFFMTYPLSKFLTIRDRRTNLVSCN